MIRLALTREEIDFLTNSVPPNVDFEADFSSRSLFSGGTDYSVDALALRLKLIAIQRMAARRPLGDNTAVYPADFLPAELWALDGALWRYDYSRMRIGGPDIMGYATGSLVFDLVIKIWDGLVAYHADSLPEMLRPPPPGTVESGLRGEKPAPMTQEQIEHLTQLDKDIFGGDIFKRGK